MHKCSVKDKTMKGRMLKKWKVVKTIMKEWKVFKTKKCTCRLKNMIRKCKNYDSYEHTVMFVTLT